MDRYPFRYTGRDQFTLDRFEEESFKQDYYKSQDIFMTLELEWEL